MLMFCQRFWINLHFVFYILSIFFRPQDVSRRQGNQSETAGGLSYGSILVNIGKCLLLLIIIPPFLNYASLQREGQVLFPKG